MLKSIFIENIVEQQLSPTYNSTYFYENDGINVTFNMKTLTISSIPNGIAHSMYGTIKSYNQDGVMVAKDGVMVAKEFQQSDSYHTLFSMDFVGNFIRYHIQKNCKWQTYVFDRKSSKSKSFGFRLIDLEYVLDGFIDKYREDYLKDIKFTCRPLNINNMGID